MNPMFNAVTNIILFGLISYFFYYDESTASILRIFVAEAFLMTLALCEGVGVFFIDSILNALHLMPLNIVVQKSIETMFSKFVLVFLYYAIVSKIWKKSISDSKKHFGLYFIIFAYSMINFVIVAVIAAATDPIISTVLMGSTLFADIYFLHFIKYWNEKEYYKLQMAMMQQQEKLQYKNYEMQREKYRQTVSILHDINKHMKTLESLYQAGG